LQAEDIRAALGYGAHALALDEIWPMTIDA